MMREYYAQRASAGLIISEATSVSPASVGYPQTPGVWSDEQVEGWRNVVAGVHGAGGRMLLQLWHVGRISDPIYHDGALPVGPSTIAAKGNVSLLRPERPYVAPSALGTDEIPPRALMEDTSHSIDVVAQQAGFADRDRMRRAFLRTYGQPPQAIRRAAGA
jgi:2,4-dienoyl-CoA reductase-like NADH-dependent reductase (Old Yellow Enzyme family)